MVVSTDHILLSHPFRKGAGLRCPRGPWTIGHHLGQPRVQVLSPLEDTLSGHPTHPQCPHLLSNHMLPWREWWRYTSYTHNTATHTHTHTQHPHPHTHPHTTHNTHNTHTHHTQRPPHTTHTHTCTPPHTTHTYTSLTHNIAIHTTHTQQTHTTFLPTQLPVPPIVLFCKSLEILTVFSLKSFWLPFVKNLLGILNLKSNSKSFATERKFILPNSFFFFYGNTVQIYWVWKKNPRFDLWFYFLPLSGRGALWALESSSVTRRTTTSSQYQPSMFPWAKSTQARKVF